MTTDTPPPKRTGKSTAKAEAKAAGQDLSEAAKDEARSLRDAAQEQIQDRAEGARDDIADEVGSVGKALRTASQDLRSGSVSEQAFASAADALADFSDSMHGRDLGEMLNEVNDFGRRNPAALLGGAALLGFAGMRLAKASRDKRAQDDSESSSGRPRATGPSAESTLTRESAAPLTGEDHETKPSPAVAPSRGKALDASKGRTEP